MESVVQYEAWIESGDPGDWKQSAVLCGIRDYNREDCDSTLELARWLRERQRETGIAFAGKPAPEEVPEPEPPSERALQQRDLARALLDEIPEEPATRAQDPERWHLQELLAYLVEFHRREAKPGWWWLIHRREADEFERFDDPECLAGLERTDRPAARIKSSRAYEYRFDPDQESKLDVGDRCRLAQDWEVDSVIEQLDPDRGVAQIKLGPSALSKLSAGEPPGRLCLIRFEHYPTGVMESSIFETVTAWQQEGDLSTAIEDFLLRRPPRIAKQRGGPLVAPGEPAHEAVVRLVGDLNESTLCIQGPPGSGKTTCAAAAILALLADGRRVGVTSNSHKAVLNLLRSCGEQAGGALAGLKVGGDETDPMLAECQGIVRVGGAGDAAALLDSRPLVGGTAWCFSNEAMRDQLDYLFVDEAGQVSIANLVAMSRSARNLVLVGDQMQLAQPLQGSHPGQSGLSLLEYLLEDHPTVPPDRGVFLDRTWRLHPEICEFISGAVYEGRLQPGPDNVNRVVRVPAAGTRYATREAGLIYLPVPHEGNRQASDEEAQVIRDLVHELLGREFTDRSGTGAGRLTPDDLLVVAPYNMQVRKLRRVLGPGTRIGSVDLFQGQQAPVVIVSMCASDGTSLARGIEFLFSRNRLNVAVSRAQSLAFVVGSPELARTVCGTVEQMRLVNLYCRICSC
jgi:uncharacterized protein